MKVPAHINYRQAFAGPFAPTPPGTVVEVQPLVGSAGFAGPFVGSAGPFVERPTDYADMMASAVGNVPATAAQPKRVVGGSAQWMASPSLPPASQIPDPVPPTVAAPPVPPAPAQPSAWQTVSKIGSWAGFLGGAYHGYKRNDSFGWAFGWALFGGAIWPLALPVMFAQGFGKPAFKTVAVANRKSRRNAKRATTALVGVDHPGVVSDRRAIEVKTEGSPVKLGKRLLRLNTYEKARTMVDRAKQTWPYHDSKDLLSLGGDHDFVYWFRGDKWYVADRKSGKFKPLA
jgi:hypothetical protein